MPTTTNAAAPRGRQGSPAGALPAALRVRAGQPLELFPVGEHARRRAARGSRASCTRRDVLIAQARRMLKDPRARGLALEFGGNWLDFRRFEQHNAVDRERFPGFTNELREAMFEEPVRLIEDVIRNDRSVLDLMYGNYTFVNPVLADTTECRCLPATTTHWVRVDDAAQYGRGGLLHDGGVPDAERARLAHQPGEARLLGRAARARRDDPAAAARRPGVAEGRSRRWIGRCARCWPQHRANPACAACHARFDSFGLAFENYGPVGERREHGSGRTPRGHPRGAARRRAGVRIRGRAGVHPAASPERLRRQSQPQAAGVRAEPNADPVRRTCSWSSMRSQLPANGYRFSSLVESHRDEPAVPEPTHAGFFNEHTTAE